MNTGEVARETVRKLEPNQLVLVIILALQAWVGVQYITPSIDRLADAIRANTAVLHEVRARIE